MMRLIAGLSAVVAATSALRVEQPSLANGWHAAARTTGQVEFTVAIQQQNIEELKRVALAVSTPTDKAYGQHLTSAEVDAITAPKAEDVAAVTEWLKAFNVNFTMASSHLVDCVLPVATAEKMLNTTWYTLRNTETRQSLDRAVGGYTIDERIAGSISTLFGVHGLPLPPKMALLTTGVTSGAMPVKVTPAVINTAYGVAGVTASGSATNVQAVAEFQGQFMIPANLVKFFAKFLPTAPPADAVVSAFKGDPNGNQEGIEADLDIQYIMGVAPGIKTEFWEQKNTDFCKDLIAWTTLLQSATPFPLVNSISYGWQGDLAQIGCQQAEWMEVDTGFAKVAAMGQSIIFASGDSGSGLTGTKCWPSWPASSPWVTAVGGTRFVNQDVTQPEMATDQFGSGGGFSSMIPRSAATWQDAAVTAYLNSGVKLPPSSYFDATGRATPDVSGLGEGYQVFAQGDEPLSVGGTSASTPMFSALISLLNEARAAKSMKPMGFLNPWIYANPGAFTDITLGTNAISRSGQKVPYGFPAAPGWDAATGLGTPIFAKMLAAATGGGPAPPNPPGPTPPGPAPPGPPSCGVPAANRTDCGFSKTESECAAAGCCYQTSDPRSYRCFNSQSTCAAIDPGARVDCGYTNTQAQCEAAGCCYDSSVPFTFKCFCKSAGPSPGPSPPTPPGPGPTPPPPPPPPTPPGPAGGHYGDPNKGPCLPDEKAVQINGITGKFCAPSCSTSSPCPAAPAGTTATPQCVVSDPNPPPSLCAVICVPGADFLAAGDGGCMPGAACQAIQGTGVCTYADTNKQTFAFNLPLYLGNDVPVAIV